MASRRIVCVLLNSFITTIEAETHPNLRGKPLIVGGDPRQRGLVAAASPEALATGVCVGMPSWEALRICPQATRLDAHPDLYTNRAQIVLSILSLFGDQVEHSQLDSFYLTTAGDAVEVMAEAQHQLTGQAGISSSIGIAANKLTAKIAARQAAPAGIVNVPIGQEADFLAPLPLNQLVDEGKQLTQLKRLGLRTIGDLAAVPEHMLAAQLGEAGKMLLRHAQGKDARLLRPTAQQETLEREHIFDRTVSDHEALRRWVVYLSDCVGQDLRAKKQHARLLTLTLGHLDTMPTVASAVLPKATDLDHYLRQASLRLLEAWDGRAGVASLGVEAGVFSAEPGFQLHLFDEEKKDEWEEQQRHLDHAKNGLNRRYGQGTVMAAMLLDDDILGAMGKKRKKQR
jgi:DNA polymerase IV